MRNQMYANSSASPFWSACCFASCAPKSVGRTKENEEEHYICVSCARRIPCIRLVRFRHSFAMDHANFECSVAPSRTLRIRNVLWRPTKKNETVGYVAGNVISVVPESAHSVCRQWIGQTAGGDKAKQTKLTESAASETSCKPERAKEKWLWWWWCRQGTTSHARCLCPCLCLCHCQCHCLLCPQAPPAEPL